MQVNSNIISIFPKIALEFSSAWKALNRDSIFFVTSLQTIENVSKVVKEVLDNKTPESVKSFLNLLVYSNFIYYTTGFIDLITLPISVIKNIEQQRDARKLGDNEKILNANLNFASLLSKFFGVISKITNFIKEFFLKNARALFHTISAISIIIFDVLELVFSFADVIQNGLNYKSTHQFFYKMKRKRHLAFLKAYFQKKKKSLSSDFERVDGTSYLDLLSSRDLQNRVKKIKEELKSQDDGFLNEITLEANKFFIQELTKKIKKNPDTLSQHFNVSIQKKDTPKRNKGLISYLFRTYKLEANFYDKMALLAKNGDGHRLSALVKLFKGQIRNRMRSQVFSIVNDSIGIINSIAMMATSAIPFSPLVGVGVSATRGVASTIHHLVVKGQDRKFVNAINNANLS